MRFFEKVQSNRPMIKSWLWVFPFIAFIVGYLVANFFLQNVYLQTPNLIGKTLQESMNVLSRYRLGLRLLQEREDSTLPDGIVLDQMPKPDQKIRPNQQVFVVVSAKKCMVCMPDLCLKRKKEVLDTIDRLGMDATCIQIKSTYSVGMCVAQSPGPNQEPKGKKVTVYFSDGAGTIAIMPDLKGKQIKQIETVLRRYDIRAEIFHNPVVAGDHVCSECVIVDQQPAAGAIVDMGRGLQVQLQVVAK